jgi:hypothetical protein
MTEIQNNTGKTRRWAAIQVTPDFLATMSGTVVVTNPLPPDTRVVRTGYCPLEDVVMMIVESDEFPPVCPGSYVPPIAGPTMRRLPQSNEVAICQKELIVAKKPYPRTCPTCELGGPCAKGL